MSTVTEKGFKIDFSISSPRCDEALRLFIPGSSQQCPIIDMIECLPETYKVRAWAMGKKRTHFKSQQCLWFVVA